MEDIKQVFDDTAKVIIDLYNEIEELTAKYGERSSLVIKKSEQLAVLTQFHERAQSEINMYRRAIHLARIVSDFKEMQIMQLSTGLSWEKVFKLHGIGLDHEIGKGLDDFDKQFKKFCEHNERLIG